MSYNFAPVINDPQTQISDSGHDNLPTDDVQVRVELKKLGQPVTYSGEGNKERRARLGALLTEQSAAQNVSGESDATEESDEEFYTPGRDELMEIRTSILNYSVARATERIARQKAYASAHNFTKVLKHRRNIANIMSGYELNGTYTMQGNQRMLSRVRFNSSEQKVACSSWEGNFYILSKDDAGFYEETHRSSLGYHSEMATIAWSPKDENILVSGGAEGKVNLWNVAAPQTNAKTTELSPMMAIGEAHSKRIAQTELFEQEGHSKEVYAMAFHGDGSLLATGGLDAIGLLWDLRSGRNVASFQGHVKGIYSMDFAPNGHHLATGSGDNSVKIWDLRKGKGAELFSIPAHTRIVSDVRFLQGSTTGAKTPSRLATSVTDENDANPETLDVSGTCLVTSSYDNTVKVWSADNWVKIKTLTGHTDRVSSCEIRSDGEEILSCGWDRTMRAWGRV
ncbi:hypothetical protein JCM33374_g3737 [Metschnikowia sp. JCM 33374]|nr:hypothetical protein JCM33374_g3737 [Metschnikowia sp. JCM 33374]